MQAIREAALSAGAGKRDMSSDALANPKKQDIGQSLPSGRLGQCARVVSTECPDFKKRKNA